MPGENKQNSAEQSRGLGWYLRGMFPTAAASADQGHQAAKEAWNRGDVAGTIGAHTAGWLKTTAGMASDAVRPIFVESDVERRLGSGFLKALGIGSGSGGQMPPQPKAQPKPAAQAQPQAQQAAPKNPYQGVADWMTFLKTDPSLKGLNNRQLREYMGVMPAPAKPMRGDDMRVLAGMTLLNEMAKNSEVEAQAAESAGNLELARELRTKSQAALFNGYLQLGGGNPLQQAIANQMNQQQDD